MILDIVTYGHPALRSKGKRIDTVTNKIRKLAADMIETMRDADGLGLAAQQVGMPLQMAVFDIPPLKNRPSAMWIGGKKVNFIDYMPLVLLNPEVELLGDITLESEGCLSFPGLQGDIPRPWRTHVRADLLDGGKIEFAAEGLLARAVQHEHDHLHGILFIDRMDPEERKSLAADLEALAKENAPL